MTVYLTADKVDDYLIRYIQILEKAGVEEKNIDKRVKLHLKDQVVIKYTKEWQDGIYDELMHIWTDVPGGYWQLQELMRSPHVEFEHYKNKSKKSYEKGNVSLNLAKKELTDRNFLFYKHFKKYDTTVGIDSEGREITEVDFEVQGKIVLPEVTKPKDL